MTVQRLGWMALALCVALGCGDDDGTTDDPPDTDGGMEAGILWDDLYAEDCSLTSCPGRLVQSACTCIAPPLDDDRLDINRVGCSELNNEGGDPRNPDDDFCDPAGPSGAPDLGCFMEGSRPTRGDVQMVTVYGVADVFGNGGDATNISIEVYEEGPDGTLGPLLGTGMAVVGDPAGPCTETEIQYENDEPVDERQLGFYLIPNIPSETPLIVKASGDPGFWRDIYAYNVYILNDEVEAAPAADACETVAAVEGPLWEYRPRVLSTSDWTSIPLSAGLVEGIRAGSGAVAGEVHDCSDVRLEFAQVGTSPLAVSQPYFNDNPDNPLPQPGRSEGTSLLGLYAALDVPEGPVDVAAIGRLDGQTVSLGWYRARVFAGAVTSLSLRGLRAHQIE